MTRSVLIFQALTSVQKCSIANFKILQIQSLLFFIKQNICEYSHQVQIGWKVQAGDLFLWMELQGACLSLSLWVQCLRNDNTVFPRGQS